MIRMVLFIGVNINRIMVRGATFCHVARIIQIGQEVLVMTDGNQKWVGAAPNLIIRAMVIRVEEVLWGVIEFRFCEIVK